jgi:hypothetical protein
MDRRPGFRLQSHRPHAIVAHGVVSTGANAGIVGVSITRRLRHPLFQPHPGRHLAIKTKQFAKYAGAQEWLRFYERALRYIIEINKQGRRGRGIT